MPRTSRRNIQPALNEVPYIYRAALYMRLSKDDGDKPESDSIANQKDLLTNYVNSVGDIEVFDRYVDDGYTGINFDRPDFQRMMKDIGDGKVDCIIVKDLSRFGRDYVNTGRYIRDVFPQKHVRFIALNDNIDSLSGQYDMLTPIKNIFNDQYSADISRKVQSALKTKQTKGEFIGAFASYGYMKDPLNKGRLVIDEYAASIVRRIFSLYLKGNGKLKIANILNDEHIVCPSEYKKRNGYKYTNGNQLAKTNYWTYSTIHRILNNELYAGDMVQHRSNRSNFRTKKNCAVPKENWIIVENTHEAIIDRAVWESAQMLLRRDTRQIDFSGVHLFSGFLTCGDCGRAMSKVNRNGRIEFVCGSYKRLGARICSQHRIGFKDLEAIVLDDVQNLIARMADTGRIVRNVELRKPADRRAAKKQIEKFEVQLNKVSKYKRNIYEDYKDGLIGREDYLRLKTDYDGQEAQYREQIDTLGRLNDQSDVQQFCGEWFGRFKRRGNITELDRMTVTDLIEDIEVYEGRKVKIIYRFSQERAGRDIGR